MRYLLLLALAGALSTQACATTANYENVLKSFVGSEEAALVQKWGPPQESYEKGDRRFLIYSSNRDINLPGTAPTHESPLRGNPVMRGQAGDTTTQRIAFTCITTFEISNGRVVSYQWRGNDCTER